MSSLTHLGQYWSARHGEVRLLGCRSVGLSESGALSGEAFDLQDDLFSGGAISRRRAFREASSGESWPLARSTYSSLPFPVVELVERLEAAGSPDVRAWLTTIDVDATGREPIALEGLDRTPGKSVDHLVAPVIPRRAHAFGVTYLNSALERQAEGQRGDYAFVYQSVKRRGERPELFIKGTAPEHFVGPGGKMGLRSDLTNSENMEGEATERVTVSAGIEPELATVVYSDGRIWGYTLANDVSGNRIENETTLYLYQAKHFTAALVLGPLIWISDEQTNPQLDITTRIFRHSSGSDEELLFERVSNSRNISAPISKLVSWASSHIRLTSGEVFSTGTDVVPDGVVKVLDESMHVEISSPQIGRLRHGTGFIRADEELNLDYSQLEFAGRRE